MDEICISSLHNFLEIVTYLKEEYPANPICNSPIDSSFLFRGMPNINYPLLPSVFRKHRHKYEGREIENSLYTCWASEKELIKRFRNEAGSFLKGVNIAHLLNWAEYAQHVGVPTRFLDWSSNPLVALYFACVGKETRDGVVWCLNSLSYSRFLSKYETEENLTRMKGKNRYELYDALLSDTNDVNTLNYPTIYIPTYIDSRMSAQSSYFMMWGTDTRPFDKMIPKENRINYNPTSKGVRTYGIEQLMGLLMKITVHFDRKQSLLRDLDMVGINQKTLFPSLDGLGQYIRWRYEFNQYDEVF